MGHIKEPEGVDLLIGPSTITQQEKELISWVIQYYKRSGKMPSQKQIASHSKLPKVVARKRTITRVQVKDTR